MGDMDAIRNIVILTGAGISAESGIRTFRAEDGLWEDHLVEDVCTPQGFVRDPELVQRFYDARRAAALAAKPNAAHRALARLDAEWPKQPGHELLIVTQNIDDLHERAGAQRLAHIHGEVLLAWCLACDERHPWTASLLGEPPCPSCNAASLRPDIVWFGEMPYRLEEIFAAISRADLFVSIGTSGAVYPAAGFVQEAAARGAATLELNLERSEGSRWFDTTRLGPASELVPQWVEEVLGSQTSYCHPRESGDPRHDG